MTDARDLRENTRAMIRLERAIEALNKTLVTIEQTRQAETTGTPEIDKKDNA